MMKILMKQMTVQMSQQIASRGNWPINFDLSQEECPLFFPVIKAYFFYLNVVFSRQVFI